MLQRLTSAPKRILMTVDAVGGVWCYAMDLAAGLRAYGTEVLFVGLGPRPSNSQLREATCIGQLLWLDIPLDWTGSGEAALDPLADRLDALVASEDIDLLHLNAPSQAVGLKTTHPVVAVCHSCIVTWFHAVKGIEPPARLRWHKQRNAAGFARADLVIAPSRSQAALIRECYGAIANLAVVPNGTRDHRVPSEKTDLIFAAARWWDEGKNLWLLNEAASAMLWPLRLAGSCIAPDGRRVDVKPAVQSLGELMHAEVLAQMSTARIVVSPSRYEPFGLTVLEAAHHGAALVLADIPTYRELWDGAAAFCPVDDPAAFASACNRLSQDRALLGAMAEAAQARSADFNLTRQAAEMFGIYQRLSIRSEVRY